MKLSKNAIIAIKVIQTMLLVCIAIMCFPKKWGAFDMAGRWTYINFFDAHVWAFGLIVVICSVVAIVLLWTKLYNIMTILTVLQAGIILFSFISLHSYGAAYELAIFHLIASILAVAISVILYLQNQNPKGKPLYKYAKNTNK